MSVKNWEEVNTYLILPLLQNTEIHHNQFTSWNPAPHHTSPALSCLTPMYYRHNILIYLCYYGVMSSHQRRLTYCTSSSFFPVVHMMSKKSTSSRLVNTFFIKSCRAFVKTVNKSPGSDVFFTMNLAPYSRSRYTDLRKINKIERKH